MPDVSLFTVLPVTADRWPELAEFFGPSGAYASCWCTWWRQPGSAFDAGCRDGGAGNRALLQRLTLDGAVPGLLAFDGEQPVGWVTVAPRPQFGRLLRSPRLRPDPADAGEDPADPTVWAVPCFWVPRAQRGRGVATALLAGAVTHAAAHGASRVEGYPVDAVERRPADAVFTGTVPMFELAGFTVAHRPPSGSRVVMVRTTGC